MTVTAETMMYTPTRPNGNKDNQEFTKGYINSPPQCAHFNNPSVESPIQDKRPVKEPNPPQPPRTNHYHPDESTPHEDDDDSDSIKTPTQIAEFLIGRLTAVVNNSSDDETEPGNEDAHTPEYSTAYIWGHSHGDEDETTPSAPNTLTECDPVWAMQKGWRNHVVQQFQKQIDTNPHMRNLYHIKRTIKEIDNDNQDAISAISFTLNHGQRLDSLFSKIR